MQENFKRLSELIKFCYTLPSKIEGHNKRIKFVLLFITRQIMTADSITKLMLPFYKSTNNSNVLNDFPSSYALLRVLYESYIHSYYVLKSKKYCNLGNLVYDVISFHVDREKYDISKKMNDTNGIHLFKERLNQKRVRIYENKKYSSLPENIKKYIIDFPNSKPRQYWHNEKLKDLAKVANIHVEQHYLIYKSLCGYTHSDGISSTEILSLKSNEDVGYHNNKICLTTENYLSQSVKLFSQICNEVFVEFEIPKEIEKTIKHYADININQLNNPSAP